MDNPLKTKISKIVSEPLSETKEDLVFEQLNPKKSTWVPPPGKFSSLDHYIQRCRTEIGQLDFRKRIRNQNLTQEELTALKSLRNRTDIVIKPADKGGAVVVWESGLVFRGGIQTTVR